ncbi:lactate utilization protein C [Paenibacillus antri]|uniref:Lactate utilization protein C n=1 Tax=Paenibacillus antri TaxID=2582848 RepID=A0A5R9FX03_9BACL|nr:LUD domain-containing protein [Paenibacillus antri]TLS48552.1 lactate utilization protein C [Paenibacillus antri]
MTDDVLKRLEARSIAKQSEFIGNIASRLGRVGKTASPPKHPFKGAPAFWNEFDLPLEERVSLFSDNWGKAGGHVVRHGSMEDAKAWIAAKANELGAKLVLRQNQPELNALAIEAELPDARVVVWDEAPKADRLAVAAGADIGLVVVDHAVAYTGSLVAKSSARKGRSVSLLPTVLFAIVPLDRMVTRLGEVLRPLDATPREALPAGVHFISGPSRSADIENDLTIGVHGPGVVYAILVG